MQPKKHWLAMASTMMIAALLVACAGPAAAPTATPVPPTSTVIPPTSTSSPLDVAKAQDPTAVVQAWLDAINNGNLEAALALMTEQAVFQGAFTDPPPNVLGWFIDGTFNYGAPDCKPSGDLLKCTFALHDGCSAAYGADDLTAKMTFAFQDGKIRRVVVMEGDGDWVGYNAWLGKMLAWAGTNRAEELPQVDFQHQTKGADIVVKICQEYAETLK